MDKEELDEFHYEFHERILVITLGLLDEEGESNRTKNEITKNNL